MSGSSNRRDKSFRRTQSDKRDEDEAAERKRAATIDSDDEDVQPFGVDQSIRHIDSGKRRASWLRDHGIDVDSTTTGEDDDDGPSESFLEAVRAEGGDTFGQDNRPSDDDDDAAPQRRSSQDKWASAKTKAKIAAQLENDALDRLLKEASFRSIQSESMPAVLGPRKRSAINLHVDLHQWTQATKHAKDNAAFPGHVNIIRWTIIIRDSRWFNMLILAVILGASVLVGIQTYDGMDEVPELKLIDFAILVIFLAEIIVKFVAEGKRPWAFFTNEEWRWNLFDFFIVLFGFLPLPDAGGIQNILRVVRLLRVLKLVKFIPKLRILVLGLLRSLSSIVYTGMLLVLVLYLFGVFAVFIFGDNDPERFGNLGIAIITLFRAATLEDWTDVMYTVMYGCEDDRGLYVRVEGYRECVDNGGEGVIGALYFIFYIMLASMMILNLFIGVVTESMAEAKDELLKEAEAREAQKMAERAAAGKADNKGSSIVERRIDEIGQRLKEVMSEIDHFSRTEKMRKTTAVIALSAKDVMNNKQKDGASTGGGGGSGGGITGMARRLSEKFSGRSIFGKKGLDGSGDEDSAESGKSKDHDGGAAAVRDSSGEDTKEGPSAASGGPGDSSARGNVTAGGESPAEQQQPGQMVHQRNSDVQKFDARGAPMKKRRGSWMKKK